MIHLARDTPAIQAAPRVPVLLDFCAAYARRNRGGRCVGAWQLVTPVVGRAVAAHRDALGLTLAQAARAAGVSCRMWTRIEGATGSRVERAFPVWCVLTWVMATGGPAFDLEG